MEDLLRYPSTTHNGKTVPKNSFYRHWEVSSKTKQRFVEDVVSINWLYKISPSVLAVEKGEEVEEITVFLVELKGRDCKGDLFKYIDENMPRHLVFILRHEEQYRIVLNYKSWHSRDKGRFKVLSTFSTPWTSAECLSLPLQGSTMDTIYENFAGILSGYGTSTKEAMRHRIEVERQIEQKTRQLEALQKKVRRQLQLNKKIELNGDARKLKQEIEELEQKRQIQPGGETERKSTNKHKRYRDMETPTKENTLYLPIKQIYFDEIIEGTKKEEYREIKDSTANRYLIKNASTGYALDPAHTNPKETYYIDRYNGGHFPFLPRRYKYLSLAVGYAKERDTALVEVTDYTFEPYYIRGEQKFATWVIAYHLGKVVELHRKGE